MLSSVRQLFSRGVPAAAAPTVLSRLPPLAASVCWETSLPLVALSRRAGTGAGAVSTTSSRFFSASASGFTSTSASVSVSSSSSSSSRAPLLACTASSLSTATGTARAAATAATARRATAATTANRLFTGSSPLVGGPVLPHLAPQAHALPGQSRAFAGRAGGFKRKKKASRPRTIHQKGLGKRMEMFWPQHDSHRFRIPMYENSRRHVIYAHHLRRWMVMWYRNGIQVFRTFPARGARFEQGRMCAILFYEKLKEARKLGVPKPDQCRSGVRGVYFDKEERSWVARWSSSGLKKYAVYNTEDLGFQEAYRKAIETRVQSIRQQHQFVFQRTRWRGQRRPLGQLQT